MLKGVYIKLREEQIEFLRKQDNASELIRDLIEEKMIRDQEYEFLIGIYNYNFDLNSSKITGIAKLVRLGIPTVPDSFILVPEVFKHFLKHKELPEKAIKELKEVFNKFRKNGDTLTIRPSIFSQNEPGLELSVRNSVNISTFENVKETVINGYETIKKLSKNPKVVEFAFIIYPFYTSDRCGLLHIEKDSNLIHIEAVFGEHTKLITRGLADPDIYEINKKSLDILSKKIVKKDISLGTIDNGLDFMKLPEEESLKSVLNDSQIKELASYAIKIERVYGSQEIEWAVLRTGELIIQEVRDLHVEQKPKILSNITVLYPGELEEEAFEVEKLTRKAKFKGKIIVTGNLGVEFITELTHKVKPGAVILTRGSIATHAVNILRKARIPTMIYKGFSVNDGQKVEISKDGFIRKLI